MRCLCNENAPLVKGYIDQHDCISSLKDTYVILRNTRNLQISYLVLEYNIIARYCVQRFLVSWE